MTKRIKILFTIPNFNTAGSGKVVYDLASGLDKKLFEIEIACGNDSGTFFNKVKSLGIPIHIFETKTGYRPYYTLPQRIYSISKFFKSHKYDIIHSWQWSSDWTEVLAAQLASSKWIYTKKAMSWGNRHWRIKSYLANFIITINDEMVNYFPNKKNQKLIPLGLDTSRYNPNLFPKATNEIQGGFRIITVANLVPVKGIEVLIEAVSLLTNTDVSIAILGDNGSEYSRSLKNLCITLGVNSQVEFIERQDDVRPFLANSDLYVIPTLDAGRKEGMPMALVEAMSMGIPVLGSNISGINFVLKDFKHLLFEPGNALKLKIKIEELLYMSRKDREDIGLGLRQYVLSKFSLDTFIHSHENLYMNLKKIN